MTIEAAHKILRLKKNEERRPLTGHLWIFSNEVDTKATPLSAFAPGDEALIQSSGGRPLGMALINPGALICARIHACEAGSAFDRDFLRRRLDSALALRRQIHPEPYFRLAFGEGDFLPGLVIDRYGDYLSVQLGTAGLERRRGLIIDALREMCDPAGIILKNDAGVRELEGLERYVEYVPCRDSGPAPSSCLARENGADFRFPALDGQKTGWFYDQRPNRAAAARYCVGGEVLDAFSYVGGFGIPAALAGAKRVTCLDASQTALDNVTANAKTNGVEDRVSTLRGDAFSVLGELRRSGERFDVVMLDPPALIKRRKDMKEGFEAYRFLNQLGISLIRPGGVLVTSSCSQHMTPPDFRRMVNMAAGRRFLQILEIGGQGPDHPINSAMPETEYLNCLICRASE